VAAGEDQTQPLIGILSGIPIWIIAFFVHLSLKRRRLSVWSQPHRFVFEFRQNAEREGKEWGNVKGKEKNG
jgi:hypothetical protein